MVVVSLPKLYLDILFFAASRYISIILTSRFMHLIANYSKLSFHINLNSNIKHHNHQYAINLSLLTKFPLLFSYWYLMSISPLSRTHVFPFSFFNTKSAISSVKSSFGVRFSGCRVEFVLSIEHFLTEKVKKFIFSWEGWTVK